jgi:hypothetical protein
VAKDTEVQKQFTAMLDRFEKALEERSKEIRRNSLYDGERYHAAERAKAEALEEVAAVVRKLREDEGA